MRKRIIGAMLVAGLLAAGLSPSRGEEGKQDPAALAKALAEARVTLDQGLRASEREGKPISGKYELEDGALQLSVYTAKANQFSEVIVDHQSGKVAKSEAITEGDDLKDAREQSAAMAKAKIPLDKAVDAAAKANAGYRAVSVFPALEGGRPVATVTLVKGQDVKKVTQKLD
jgi:hypothetical protein